MAACRRISCFAKKSQTFLFKHSVYYCTTTSVQVKPETAPNEIVIPYRIERGPTDVLKALASTLSKDYTAPLYKYEDDPYFIPSSNITKRSFALSKESGRKAARYFLENYPELFKCNKSVPHIKERFFARTDKGPEDKWDCKGMAEELFKEMEQGRSGLWCFGFQVHAKRSFALSKESGRKAARYFLENYPELFKCNKSVPHIKAFDPPIVYTEENVTSAESLRDCIMDCHVDNSILVYNILKTKGIAVSEDLKQDLLELLCFYNCKQPVSDEYYEERFFARTDKGPEDKWDCKGMAEELFKEMEQGSQAYGAMISGAAKFRDADRALSLFAEMKDKGLPGTVEVYNSLISISSLIQEAPQLRFDYVQQLLGNMTSDGLQPNLYTMNAILESFVQGRWRKSMPYSLSVLAEMRRLKIEPSVGTYYLLLMIFCSNDFSNATVLYDIMNQLGGKELEIRHPTDVYFFNTAMEVCLKSLRDKELGYCIHNLLEFKNNCKLLGNSFSESQYFKFFFKLLCQTEEMDKLMDIYEKYVPNSYTPEPSVTLAIIEAIHFSGNYKHLPKMCSDVLFFEQTERENILTALMDAAGCMKHDDKTQEDLVNMVWNIFEKLNQRSERRRLPFDWSGVLLGNFLKTFMNGNSLEKSWAVIKKLKDEEYSIMGYPENKHLLKFCELCLKNEDYNKLLYCMKYAVNSSYPDFKVDVEKLASEMFEQEKLPMKQRPLVNAVLQSASNASEESDSDSDTSSSESSSDESSSDEEKEPEKKDS
ncbi:Protein PTCD3, mitochondrial [Araneus ventricosus]|uniref:Small ribosomal subunit protein mS39 n=1 Tax=Araneus ventricosus TaxID=182803 RepID=A0A4Y2BP69_ARAVE|nr:Protein PTCD3, mitochondrial [Araneus ventricosus]